MKQLLRVIPIAIAVAFLVPAMTPAVAEAQSVDQQKQKVEDIVDQLERLEERALHLGEEYNDAIDTKSLLDVEIADAEARIAEQEAELAVLRSNLSEMALRSFVGGGAAPLGPLFEDAANLNDALQREELAKVALSAGDVTTDKLDALVADINDERKALDNKRQQAEQLAESLVEVNEFVPGAAVRGIEKAAIIRLRTVDGNAHRGDLRSASGATDARHPLNGDNSSEPRGDA